MRNVKSKWILGVAAEIAVVAAWILAGWAAHQSMAESDAKRAAAVEPAPLHAQQPRPGSPG